MKPLRAVITGDIQALQLNMWNHSQLESSFHRQKNDILGKLSLEWWRQSKAEVPAPCRNISFTCSFYFAAFTNIKPHFKVICIISFPFSSPNFTSYLLATLTKYPAHRHLLSISVLEPSNVSLGKSGSWENKKPTWIRMDLQEKAVKPPPSHGF